MKPLVLWLALLGMLACDRQDVEIPADRTSVAEAPNERRDTGVQPTTNHPVPAEQDTARLSLLVDTLAEITGEFQRTNYGWEFVGDKAVFRELLEYRHDAVERLADCIGNMRPAVATVDGQPVPTGAMCLEALMNIAYYEPYEHEADPDTWAGLPDPLSSQEEFAAAERAWKRVVQNRWYRLSL